MKKLYNFDLTSIEIGIKVILTLCLTKFTNDLNLHIDFNSVNKYIFQSLSSLEMDLPKSFAEFGECWSMGWTYSFKFKK